MLIVAGIIDRSTKQSIEGFCDYGENFDCYRIRCRDTDTNKEFECLARNIIGKKDIFGVDNCSGDKTVVHVIDDVDIFLYKYLSISRVDSSCVRDKIHRISYPICDKGYLFGSNSQKIYETSGFVRPHSTLMRLLLDDVTTLYCSILEDKPLSINVLSLSNELCFNVELLDGFYGALSRCLIARG